MVCLLVLMFALLLYNWKTKYWKKIWMLWSWHIHILWYECALDHVHVIVWADNKWWDHRKFLFLLPCNKQAMVDRFDHDVQIEGAVDEVLWCTTLQVSVHQEIPNLLCTLVEIVYMANNHFTMLLCHHDDCLLETHSGKVRAGRGRRYDDARSTSLCASGLHSA